MSTGSTGTAGEESLLFPCRVFSEFKEALQQERAIDDQIKYKLNTSVPTQSFAGQVNARDQCMALYGELLKVHKRRVAAIEHCIDYTMSQVHTLSESRNSNQSDPAVVRNLRKEQTKLRLMQSELVVEEVVRDNSMKVFKEKCWKSYRPPEHQDN